MRSIGIVSHLYQGESVIFCLEKGITHPLYCKSPTLPIHAKVVFECEIDDDTFESGEKVYVSSIVAVGASVYDSTDDDEMLRHMYQFEEIQIEDVCMEDPFTRRHMEDLFVCTIDPPGSKDLDDALSICDDTLYIHIADVVSYFAHDIETLTQRIFPRGNTIYLRHSNIPMIGGMLANDVISLLPGATKRAITLEFDLSSLMLKDVYPSCICNSYQLCYEDVDSILDGALHEDERVNRLVDGLKSVYHILHARPKIQMNTSSVSHRIIEEIMILANTSIAKKIGEKGVYRFHNKPYSNKAGYLQRFIGCQTETFIPLEMNELCAALDTVPQTRTVHHLVKHMMSKALYTQEETSHWALHLSHYVHFTSPIRRAADIMIHCALFLPESGIDMSKYVNYLNLGEELQKSIETILEELDRRRKIEVSRMYNACVIKVLYNEVEYYIPELDMRHAFHISQLSSGEFLSYDSKNGGRLVSANYCYTLGKCNPLFLESFHVASGKKVFGIVDCCVGKWML